MLPPVIPDGVWASAIYSSSDSNLEGSAGYGFVHASQHLRPSLKWLSSATRDITQFVGTSSVDEQTKLSYAPCGRKVVGDIALVYQKCFLTAPDSENRRIYAIDMRVGLARSLGAGTIAANKIRWIDPTLFDPRYPEALEPDAFSTNIVPETAELEVTSDYTADATWLKDHAGEWCDFDEASSTTSLVRSLLAKLPEWADSALEIKPNWKNGAPDTSVRLSIDQVPALALAALPSDEGIQFAAEEPRERAESRGSNNAYAQAMASARDGDTGRLVQLLRGAHAHKVLHHAGLDGLRLWATNRAGCDLVDAVADMPPSVPQEDYLALLPDDIDGLVAVVERWPSGTTLRRASDAGVQLSKLSLGKEARKRLVADLAARSPLEREQATYLVAQIVRSEGAEEGLLLDLLLGDPGIDATWLIDHLVPQAFVAPDAHLGRLLMGHFTRLFEWRGMPELLSSSAVAALNAANELGTLQKVRRLFFRR